MLLGGLSLSVTRSPRATGLRLPARDHLARYMRQGIPKLNDPLIDFSVEELSVVHLATDYLEISTTFVGAGSLLSAGHTTFRRNPTTAVVLTAAVPTKSKREAGSGTWANYGFEAGLLPRGNIAGQRTDGIKKYSSTEQ